MYKQRFRRWGFKKNIRLHETEDEINYCMLDSKRDKRHSTEHSTSAVQLASGQVVDLERLVTHLRRKMLYRRHTQKTIALTSVNPPEEFYVCEAVLNDTRSYLVSTLIETALPEDCTLTVSGLKSERPLPRSLYLYRRGRYPPRHPTCYAQMEPLLLPLPWCSRAPLALQPSACPHATSPGRITPPSRERACERAQPPFQIHRPHHAVPAEH